MTVGAEGTNAINVALVLQDERRRTLASTGRLRAWLSEDAAGLSMLRPELRPAGGYAIGTNGTLFKGHTSQNCVLVKGGLAIDAVPEKFKTTATAFYKVAGAQYTKAAATAIVFSAAHPVTASKFGAILVQINAAGTVSTKITGATQTTAQAFATAAAALAALPMPDAGNVALGYIQIAAKAALWTANTDDMTNGSDLTTAAFIDASEVGDYPAIFDLMSNATGLVDVTFSETGVRNPFYLNVEVAGGKVLTSGAIAFA